MRDNVRAVRIRGRAAPERPSLFNGFELIAALYLLPRLESLAILNALCLPHFHIDDCTDLQQGQQPALRRFVYVLEAESFVVRSVQFMPLLQAFPTIMTR